MFEMQKVTFAHGGFARVGGIETFTADLAAALKARHVQTELVCWSGRGSSENPALQRLGENGVTIHRTDWRRGCRWGWPDKVMVLHQWNRFADAEVLVFGKLLDPGAHRRLLRLKKRMILITPYRPAEMWKRRAPDGELLNSLEAIIVQAPGFESDLRAFGYRGKVFIFPLPPPETEEARPWPANSLLQIGFLGRLVPDKNVEYLIISFSRLREMGTAAQLHVFGDGPECATLQSLANQLGLADYVEFHGNQDRHQIPEAIDRCHLFAFPSRTEGLPIGALEILARGRPIVGTPVGALPEFLLGSLGCIAPLNDPAAFANAMKAKADPILNGQVTSAEIQTAYVSRFPRRQVIDKYLQVFGCLESTEQKVQTV
jgi:glycosyltransferase involved in cell wall biosynthesis